MKVLKFKIFESKRSKTNVKKVSDRSGTDDTI